MSSNFTVKRVCEQCNEVFLARTTVTRFCSKLCNKSSYKLKARNAAMIEMSRRVQAVLTKPIEELRAMEFLSIQMAARLLGTSDKMIRTLIRSGQLKAANLAKRKTVIQRKEIDKLIEFNEVEVMPGRKEASEPKIKYCYHINEAQRKFNVSEGALYHLIKREGINKYRMGRYTYVAKKDLDFIFKGSDRKHEIRKDNQLPQYF